MSEVPTELRDEIPSFEKTERVDVDGRDWSALGSAVRVRGVAEIAGIVALAVAMFWIIEGILALTDVEEYVFPRPTVVVQTLVSDFGTLYASHLWVTIEEFLIGFAIGSTIGLVLAAVITQKPYVEKIVAPYVIVLVVTPMIALVPFLRLSIIKGFSIWPIVVAVALASAPMVLINSATGFRRTDLAKIALARSYGASTFQIFRKIRFPLALPMIIVGYMIGSIFGLLTAVGGEMVAASERGGLGRQLIYFSSLIQMPHFGGVILLLAGLGILIYVVFFFIGRKWASWEA